MRLTSVTKSNTGKLQPGGGLFGAGRDEAQRIGAHGRVGLVFQHFEPVDHRADRAHKIVAHTRYKQGCKFKVVHGKAFGVIHGDCDSWFTEPNCRPTILRIA